MTKFKCKVSINHSVLSAILDDPSTSLVGSIDQGTSSSRFLIVTSVGKILSTAQVEFRQQFPASSPYNSGSCEGWHEHDPFDIWDSVCSCIVETVEELARLGVDLTGEQASRIKAVGITNQRETTVAWNNRTGKLYYNAIVWDDTRTASVADTIIRENGDSSVEKSQDVLRAKTGLPVASYFAGTKVRWLIDNIKELQADLSSSTEREQVRFGTIDVWLTYMFTGFQRTIEEDERGTRLAHEGGVFKTDVSNGSRWLFMDLETLDWDGDLVKKVVGSSCELPLATLPKIFPSSDASIGIIRGIGRKLALKNVPIAGIIGDQQAALFGQACYQPGEAKCTYGTGKNGTATITQ